jgi:DNA-binding NarL/FixJ family response regulator
MTWLNVNDARCEALFASALQPSDSPTAAMIAEAISWTLRQFGAGGCAGRMAQEFGDHPDAAARRMRWVRQAMAVVPDVVLIGLHMPNCDGAEATRLIADKQPHVRVMVLTAFSDDDPVFGEAQLDPSVRRGQAGAMVRGERPGVPAAWQAGSAPDGLTQREVEVLTEIGAGLSNAEIAAKFRISGATVKSHINHLLTKTATRDRGQLVAYAFRHGMAA